MSWPEVREGFYVLHPDPITLESVSSAIDSGALFARKFDVEVSHTSHETFSPIQAGGMQCR